MDHAKILIVEDNPIVAEDTRLKVESMGYSVTAVARNGKLALEAAGREVPDIALMDINLGEGINGIDTAMVLKKEHQVPVIYITAYTDGETIARAKQTEPYGYIVKPFNEDELHSVIEIALHKKRSDRKIRESRQWLQTTLKCIGDGVIATDRHGRVVFMNAVAEKLTGWLRSETRGLMLDKVFNIIGEKTRRPVDNPVARVIRDQVVVGLANHTLLISRDGREIPIADSGAPIRNEHGGVIGVVLVFRDQTEERLAHRMVQIRLRLLEYAVDHSLDQLLVRALDEVGEFVTSPIGFYHFVGPDQKTLTLQQWSTRTLQEFCTTEVHGSHYGIHEAGVWVDCVHRRRPVIHNDYASLPHKKGMPEGHAEVIRELVVPVMRDDKVVAILGVGNKATDYTAKDAEMVSYLADVTWEIIQQKRIEKRLGLAIQQWQSTFDSVNAAIWILDEDQRVLRSNTTAAHMFDHPVEELVGKFCWEIAHCGNGPMKECPLPKARQSLARETMELQIDDQWFEVAVDPILDKDHAFAGAVHIITNITPRKRHELEKEKLHAQLLHSQKMESVGRLAGGVAHDFNNMLSVIIGHAELAINRSPAQAPIRDDLQEILNAAQRSADLTRQLLGFARRQTAIPKVLDLNDTVSGMLKMLRRLIGEDINLAWMPGARLLPVKVDPAQIDQILANLCVNSRDAIDGVGKITIETQNVTIDASDCDGNAEMTPGKYVMLAVGDNGCGIPTEALDHIFEPFFTTKAESRGTGLGLATVYGIVKQNGGFINIHSEPGSGTAIKLYLPPTSDALADHKAVSHTVDMSGTETVLLVEDESAILGLAKAVLERFGYTVLAAGTPGEALAAAQSNGSPIQLMITDVVLPDMNGKELVERISKIQPGMEVIFMSGYTSDVMLHHGILQGDVHFLQKPFSLQSLGAKVREVLDQQEA